MGGLGFLVKKKLATSSTSDQLEDTKLTEGRNSKSAESSVQADNSANTPHSFNIWEILFVAIVFMLVGVMLGGLLFSEPKSVETNNSFQQDLNSVIQNQSIVANYVQQEAQCLQAIQKCQMVEDNNIGFSLRCLR